MTSESNTKQSSGRDLGSSDEGGTVDRLRGCGLRWGYIAAGDDAQQSARDMRRISIGRKLPHVRHRHFRQLPQHLQALDLNYHFGMILIISRGS